jgi:lipopolysaccharide transport system permease protein
MDSKVFASALLFKAQSEMKAEVSTYYLNYFWWILEPMLFMTVLYVIFGVLFQNDIEYYPAFLLSGLVSWNWFNRTVSNAAGSIVSGCGLMSQINIPKVFFPLEVFLRDAMKQLIVLALLLIFLFFYPSPISATWLLLPLLLVIQAILVLGCAILCAAVVPHVPDLKPLIATALMMMFFGSGIFFDIEKIEFATYREIMYYNPMATIITSYRDILVYSRMPDWGHLAYASVVSFLLLGAALAAIWRLDKTYVRTC